MTPPFPWQLSIWDALARRHRAERLPHALLLSGPTGLGKHAFARLFAQSLLCHQPQADGLPCASCRSCLLFAAGTHPDLMSIEPEEPGKAIKVDQIRRLRDYAAVTSQYGRHKVVLIQPAERMNPAAANSLLKTLEEPAPQTALLLVTAEPAQLLATIRSRCQAIAFAPPAQGEAVAWLRTELPADAPDPGLLLRLAHGAPLRALDLVTQGELEARGAVFAGLQALAQDKASVVEQAEAWLKLGAEVPLQWMYAWVSDLIRAGAGALDQVRNTDQLAALQAQAERVDSQGLFTMLDALSEARRLARGQVNAQLLLETVLLDWTRATKRSRTA